MTCLIDIVILLLSPMSFALMDWSAHTCSCAHAHVIVSEASKHEDLSRLYEQHILGYIHPEAMSIDEDREPN